MGYGGGGGGCVGPDLQKVAPARGGGGVKLGGGDSKRLRPARVCASLSNLSKRLTILSAKLCT